MTPTVDNVLAVYRMASAQDMREGLSWYVDAHNFARLISPGDVARGAGIIAALSPLMSCDANKVQASRVVQRGNADGLGLRRNCDKAMAIYNGADPLDILSGNKVRSFFQTILDPSGDIDPVIDRHAFDIAVGFVTVEGSEKILSRKGVYGEFAQVYRDAAEQVGIGSAQMQAITWLTWRRYARKGFKVIAPADSFVLAA